MITLKANQPTARKDHICNFCLSTIPKGESYNLSTHVYDNTIYDWKSHKKCNNIANTLKMYDDADEGVNTDMFMESISQEYHIIMSTHHQELYESEDFNIPDFDQQLEIVCKFHLQPNSIVP